MFGDEPNHVLRDGHFQVIELCLLLKDCNSVLKVWRLDVCHHAPLESAD